MNISVETWVDVTLRKSSSAPGFRTWPQVDELKMGRYRSAASTLGSSGTPHGCNAKAQRVTILILDKRCGTVASKIQYQARSDGNTGALGASDTRK